MKKVVVYTALFGAYDSELIEVDYDRSKFDFVCFTNQKRLKSKTWEMRYVDEPVPGDNPRSAYYYKTNPHKAVPEYDISVWMDSSCWKLNVPVLENFINKFKEMNESLWIEKHPGRNCVYQELEANVRLQKDDVDAMRKHVETYRQEGMPANFGMVETGLQFRKHNNKGLIKFQELLWHEMTTKTRRDQLSWNYCAWKLNFKDFVLFSFEQKCSLLYFKDHPHRPHHIEKVLVAGPWFGEDDWEKLLWVPYVKSVIEKKPLDRVVIATRPGHEKYYDFHVDEFKLADPVGPRDGCLFAGREPSIKLNKTSDKEIILESPTKVKCATVAKQIIDSTRVVCIGMFKTGTTSLGRAFDMMGFKTLHGPWYLNHNEWNDIPDEWPKHYDEIREKAKQYNAYQDYPWMFLYKEMDEWFPGTKFILLERDAEAVADSDIKMAKRWNASRNANDPIPPKEKYVDRYKKHKMEVLDYFQDKDNLLVLPLVTNSDIDNWKAICEFVGVPAPKVAFPHANQGDKK